MRNIIAIAGVAACVGCAQTPCEREAEIVTACVESRQIDPVEEEELPDCADDSTEACQALCTVDREETYCTIYNQTADDKTIQSYNDCLITCTKVDEKIKDEELPDDA